MAINPVPGFSGYISVQDKQGRELYRQDIDSEVEGDIFIQTHSRSIQGWSLLKASFIVMRTDEFSDFCKDFFLPTFFNHALNVKNCVLKIFACIAAVAWDLLTFIPRGISASFRLLGTPPITHSLARLIPGVQQAGEVKLIFHSHTVSVQQQDRYTLRAQENSQDKELIVRVKEMPGRAESGFRRNRSEDYEKNGEMPWRSLGGPVFLEIIFVPT